MKIGSMQPYSVPHIEYWQLMNTANKYVVYYDVNFIKQGWINHNQILANGQPRYSNEWIKLPKKLLFLEKTMLFVEWRQVA